MNTDELYKAVLSSRQLELAIERFTDVNGIEIESNETECFVLGYVEAVKDVYKFMQGDNQLILKIYEKQELTTK